MGDRYLRKLLVAGACATLRDRHGHNDTLRLWASGMLERKTVKYRFKLTAVALANNVARIVFVPMTRGGQYDDRPLAARTSRFSFCRVKEVGVFWRWRFAHELSSIRRVLFIDAGPEFYAVGNALGARILLAELLTASITSRP
jgi:hypothetical protein